MSQENVANSEPINKEKVADEKVMCECKKEILKRNLATHQKSKQHLKAMGVKEEPLPLNEQLKLMDDKLVTIMDVLDEMLDMASGDIEEDEIDATETEKHPV
jgi:hypothetical protein